MPNQTILVHTDVFNILKKKPNSWIILLPIKNYMIKNDILTVEEIDSNNIPTGQTKQAKLKYIIGTMEQPMDKTKSLHYFCPTI